MRVGAYLWIVQGNTCGPLAEISHLPATLEELVQVMPGVARERRFASHTIQREYNGPPLWMGMQGSSWLEVHGDWLTYVRFGPTLLKYRFKFRCRAGLWSLPEPPLRGAFCIRLQSSPSAWLPQQ